MNEICSSTKCTGCGACANICAHKCIKMLDVGDFGHVMPVIDQSKCVHCGLCSKICPQNNKKLGYNLPVHVYAAWAKDELDYRSSTSGAASSVFANEILSHNGVVYGAAVDNDLRTKHIRIDSSDNVNKIKGSKYVQSYIDENLFCQVLRDLKLNKQVVFFGTPCQVDGLKFFLRKDFDNLFLIDIVCHGVPSWKLFKEHICEIENKQEIGEIDNYSFRNNGSYILNLYKNKRVVYQSTPYKDFYYYGFLKRVFFREACYSCPYAKSKRISDITIGDFWGIKGVRLDVKPQGGLSLIMINSEKGERLFNNSKTQLYHEERTLSEAVAGNKQLRHPSKRNRNYKRFKALYQEMGFETSMKKTFSHDIRIQRMITHFLKLIYG